MDDDFCIGVGSELMAFPLQLFSQFLKIIDLPIENHPYGPVLIGQRLVSAGQIDNAQAAMSQEDEWGFLTKRPNVFPLIIWATMEKTFTHSHQNTMIRNILSP
jgi:hypothetical protein